MSLLRRIEKSLEQRLRSIFASGEQEPGAREGIELYRDALDQIATRATPGKRGDRLLPFNLITIELRADDPERKAVLETLFDAGQLSDDIHATLKAERVTAPTDMTVAVKFPPGAEAELRVLFERIATPDEPASAPVSMPQAVLVTVAGASSSQGFRLNLPRVNLGRTEAVLDPVGRIVRHNDLYFPEDAHDANPSVSRTHAHIAFDPASGDWRIFDDGSSVGTTLFRNGKRVDVPPHASRGIALRQGDDIYLGQVRLRFELI